VRADIWAFGVMLYEMLVGEPPFTGESFPAVVMTILTQPVPDLSQIRPDVSDGLADLVYRMLEKDRQQRVPSVRLVGADLEAMLHQQEIVSPAPRLAPAAPPVVDRFAPPTPPADVPRHNLPVQPTPFVGREAELTEVARLLGDPDVRLLTILGAGGMGKTRLALETGAAEIGNFEHGVYFVSLAPLRSVDAIVPTVAEAVGFSFYEGPEPQRQLLDYLRQKQTLLIMDNFEHLLACPEPGRRDSVGLVTDVLKTALDVKVLSTSRARLNVQREHLFHLVGMEFPDWETPEDALDYSAVKLFLQSARRVRPGFELHADDLKYVGRICRLVQGMPLGILLAAGWVEMLTLEEIAAEIGQSLDFLETDLRDVPERQRSIRGVFDHSWNLLKEREREVFQALSVFRGGFTRQAAQQVTGASLRELIALVNKSLLHRMPTGRYEVHELLRQYAEEKLDQSPTAGEAARNRHCAYYTAALQRWEADLKGPRQKTVIGEMDVEIENAREAWQWAADQRQVERLDQAMTSLGLFYEWRGRYQEGEVAYRKAAEKLAAAPSGEELRVLVKIMTWQSFFSRALGSTEFARQLLQQSLVLLEEPELATQDTRPEEASVLLQMGRVMPDSDREEARRLYEQSLALYQAVGDRWGMASALRALGWVAENLATYGEAERLCKESLAIRRALGGQRGIASSLISLGSIAVHQGQLEEAERLIRGSIAICQEIGDQAGIASGLANLGVTLLFLGKSAEARSALQESVAIYNDLGFRDGLVLSNIWLSVTEMQLGRYEQTRAQARANLVLAREIGYGRGIGYSLLVLGGVALVEEAYAEAQQLFQESIVVYREVGQLDELGWVLASLGHAARGLGDIPRMGQHLYEALRTTAEIRAFTPLMTALPAMALLLAEQGEKERAVELYALASRYPFVANSHWLEDVAGRHIAAVAATLPPDVVAAAQERGKARDLDSTVAELLEELED
jgi:predicted ATPase